jgi:hypothetical protein
LRPGQTIYFEIGVQAVCLAREIEAVLRLCIPAPDPNSVLVHDIGPTLLVLPTASTAVRRLGRRRKRVVLDVAAARSSTAETDC